MEAVPVGFLYLNFPQGRIVVQRFWEYSSSSMWYYSMDRSNVLAYLNFSIFCSRSWTSRRKSKNCVQGPCSVLESLSAPLVHHQFSLVEWRMGLPTDSNLFLQWLQSHRISHILSWWVSQKLWELDRLLNLLALHLPWCPSEAVQYWLSQILLKIVLETSLG